MQISFNDQSGQVFDLEVGKLLTIKEVKQLLADYYHSNNPELIVLVYNGSVLIDERTVMSYEFPQSAIIYVVRKNNPSNQTSKPKKPKSTSPPPSFIDSFANSDIGKSFMKQLEDNPDQYSALFNNNSVFQSVADKNPVLNHFMNDPEQVTEQLKISTTPGNKTQAALSMDRMMDIVEQTPMGINMMNRMMNDIQNPLMDGLTESMFSRSQQKTVIPKQDLSKPSEDPLPGNQPNPIGPKQWNRTFSVTSESLDMFISGFQKCQEAGLTFSKGNDIIIALQEIKEKQKTDLYADLSRQYSSELQELHNMGFFDDKISLFALRKSKGNLQRAVMLIMRYYSKPKK